MTESKTTDDSYSAKSRPNSSRFPPITSPPKSATSRDKRIPIYTRSTSLDILHKSNERPKSSTGYKVIHDELISLKKVSKSLSESPAKIENNFDYNEENINSKLWFPENGIERKCNELIKLQNEMTEIRPLSPFDDFIDCIDSNEENQRLRKENEALKRNFIKMTDIISKHNKQMSRKDNIILKLQKKYSTKDSLTRKKESSKDSLNSKSQLNCPNNDRLTDKSDSNNNNNTLHECLSESIILSETSHLISGQLLEKFTIFIDSVILEFRNHFIHFHKSIEEIKQILQNCLKLTEESDGFESVSSSREESKDKYKESNDHELKKSYEVLLNENNNFKQNINYLCKLCDVKRSENLSTDWNKLQTIYENLVERNRKLKHESEKIENNFKKEEESAFSIIEMISEIELELELLGRNQKSLDYVITKSSSKFDSFNGNQDSLCLLSLKKIVLQLYKNQLKWSQSLPNHSFVTYNVSESTDDEDYDKSHSKNSETKTSIEYEAENSVSEDLSVINTIEHLSSDLLDKALIDDIDIESINYILLNRSFNHNIYSNLEVVNEEEEEEYVDNERETEDETEDEEKTIEELQFDEELDNELNDKNMKITSLANHGCDRTELVVKQVLNEMIDAIDKDLNEQLIKNNQYESDVMKTKGMKTEENTTFVPKVEREDRADASTQDSFQSLSEINELPFVRVNVMANNNSYEEKLTDSAFASEDNCSSPEATQNKEKSNHSTECNSEIKSIPFNKLKIDEKNLTIRLQQLEVQKELQTAELSLANSRISQLESIIADNDDYNSVLSNNKQQSHQYLNDELKAWKELVEQQKAIMEKIRNELEDTQSLVREKDKVIDILKRPESNTSNEVETQTNGSENCISIESERFEPNIISQIVFNPNNDLTDDEFGLNTLFDYLSDDGLDKIKDFKEREIDSIDICEKNEIQNENRVNSEKERAVQQAWNDSEYEKIRSNASSKNSYYANNELSDESSYSVESEIVSKSKSDEIFTKTFSKSYNVEESRRRHSCQGRVISYGNHPRKPKLELKKVEIVFNTNVKDKNKNKISSNRKLLN